MLAHLTSLSTNYSLSAMRVKIYQCFLLFFLKKSRWRKQPGESGRCPSVCAGKRFNQLLCDPDLYHKLINEGLWKPEQSHLCIYCVAALVTGSSNFISCSAKQAMFLSPDQMKTALSSSEQSSLKGSITCLRCLSLQHPSTCLSFVSLHWMFLSSLNKGSGKKL